MPLTTAYLLTDPPGEHDLRVLDALSNIITNGIESGYLQYWAKATEYTWCDSKAINPPGRAFHATATLREHNEEEDSSEWGEPFDLTPETLLVGVLRIINGQSGLGSWSDLPGRLLAMLQDPTEHDDFDAEDADIIIQATMLGELRYG